MGHGDLDDGFVLSGLLYGMVIPRSMFHELVF